MFHRDAPVGGIDRYRHRNSRRFVTRSAEQDALFQFVHTDNAFNDSRCSQGMAEIGLQTMDGHLFQMSQCEGFGFHFIIVYGSCAVCIDKADILRGCPCFLHGLADGEIESVSRAGRTGDVVGIVTDGSSRKDNMFFCSF